MHHLPHNFVQDRANIARSVHSLNYRMFSSIPLGGVKSLTIIKGEVVFQGQIGEASLSDRWLSSIKLASSLLLWNADSVISNNSRFSNHKSKRSNSPLVF
ncbi:hypothetical protein ES703_102127 [subsurface metagenome]